MTHPGESVTDSHRPSYNNDEFVTLRGQPDALEALKRGFPCRFIQLHLAADGPAALGRVWDLYVELDEPLSEGVPAPAGTPARGGRTVGTVEPGLIDTRDSPL